MNIEPVSRKNLSEQVADSIRDAILDGSLSPGDRLPPERKLAERFGVNRSSVREALGRLQALRLVEARQGGGIFVRDFLAEGGLAMLPYLISPSGSADLRMIGDVLEVRAVFCAFLAEQAALRAQPQDLSALRAALDELEAAASLSERQRLDFEFFRTLAGATRNRVMLLVVNAIRRVYRENALLFEELYDDDRFDTQRHERVLDAVTAGDAETAAREVRRWMDVDRELGEPPGPLPTARGTEL